MKELFSIRVREYTYRYVIIAILVVSGFVSCFSLWYAYVTVQESKKNIYVLLNSRALVQAQSTDLTNSYDILAKGAIQRINQLIYQHVPDTKNMNNQLNEAITMSDKSAANIIDALKSHEYYQNLLAQNFYTLLITDSINIDYSSDPQHFRYVGTLHIIREKIVAFRRIVTEGEIQKTDIITTNNERGFIIHKFRLVIDQPYK